MPEARRYYALCVEWEARRRTDTILAQLARANEKQARTIRELEPPPETTSVRSERPERAEPVDPEREKPERAEPADPDREEPERVEPRPDPGGPREGSERPWWRRVFGG